MVINLDDPNQADLLKQLFSPVEEIGRQSDGHMIGSSMSGIDEHKSTANDPFIGGKPPTEQEKQEAMIIY